MTISVGWKSTNSAMPVVVSAAVCSACAALFSVAGCGNQPSSIVKARLGDFKMEAYSQDFEAPVGPEWSTDARETTPTPTHERRFLGQFKNQIVTLSLSDLPAHMDVTVSFDLFVIGSWDGSGEAPFGPDLFSLSADGRTLINTTFAYSRNAKQAYPGSFPADRHDGRTGALENDSLGYRYFDGGVLREWNSVYHLSATMAHSDPTLDVAFAVSGLEDFTESWGIDNVSVRYTPPQDGWNTVLTIEAENFDGRPRGGLVHDGWNIWQTGQITDWVDFPPGCDKVRASVVVKSDPADGQWPIMGLMFNQRYMAHTTITQRDWSTHSFDVDIDRPGVTQIAIAFTNDSFRPGQTQDRNLYVDRIEFAVPEGTGAESFPTRARRPAFLDEPVIPATDEEALALAEDNIERYRKGDFVARLTGPDGHPLSNRSVRFDMFRHHFKWGSAIRFDLDHPDSPTERRYRTLLGRMFDYGTTENLLRWAAFEPKRGQTRADDMYTYLDNCAALGIELKGHNLVWGHFLDIPSWITDNDIAHALERIESRLRRDVGEFSGKLTSYDVVNEPMHALQWEFWAGPTYLEDALEITGALDPEAELIINEYELVGVPSQTDNFYVRMKEAQDRGAPLSGIGIQLHSNLGEWYEPRDMWRCYERLKHLGVNMHLTEVSLGAQNTHIVGGPYDGEIWRDDLQADYYEQVMVMTFGHPDMDSLTYWGFTDGRHFQPGSGLMTAALKNKPSGERYRRLIEEDWSTHETVQTSADGVGSIRGFFGWYRVTLDDRIGVVYFRPDATGTADEPLSIQLHLPGDGNGDGLVNSADAAAFEACYTGDDNGVVLGDCQHFDFDFDRDVDCADHSEFVSNWTGQDSAPDLPQCSLALPDVAAKGSRYLWVTPPPGDDPVAIRVTSEDWLCMEWYVDERGFATDEPVFMTPEQWGTVEIAEGQILPDTSYYVQVRRGDVLSERASAKTWKWGDANNDGVVDDTDAALVRAASDGDFDSVSYQAVDLVDCVPDRSIDVDDVFAVLEAIDGGSYLDKCPAPCSIQAAHPDP